MNKFKKKCDASIRVLETLKFLSSKNASVQDLITHFEKIDPKNRIYSSEVIQKYINTLKVADYKLTKIKDKNVLLNPPPQFEFSESELQGLYILGKFVNLFPEEKLKSDISQFLQDLEKRFGDKTSLLAQKNKKNDFIHVELSYDEYAEKVQKIEKYCSDKQRLKITYLKTKNSETSIIAEPNELKYAGKIIYFSIYNPILGQIYDIDINLIKKVEQLPTISNSQSMLSSVSFLLKDRLAKAYKLREYERLSQKNSDGSILIINQREDRGMLLKRLMRYGENCEIVSPKDLKEEMKQRIKASLELYS